MTNGVRHKFRYYRILYPFSITIASTAKDENLYRSGAYTVFTWLMFIVNSFVAVDAMRRLVSDVSKLTLLDRTVANSISWICYTLNYMKMIKISRKRKVQKLIEEIVELDYNLDHEFEISSLTDGIWCFGLLAYHLTLFFIHVSLTHTIVLTISQMFLDISVDTEISCLAMFSTVLCSRLKYFIEHLESLLSNERNEDKKIDILLCYRQTLHILKRITNIWELQIYLSLGLSYYNSIRFFMVITMALIHDNYSALEVIFCYMLFVRHLLVFVRYGVLGHRLASKFERVSWLIMSLNDSHLDGETRASIAKMLRLQRVRCSKLTVLGVLDVDGLLPLRLVAAVVAAVIISLQLGIKMD